MIALFDRDELVAFGFALRMPEIPDEADRAVDRVRAAEAEIAVIEIPRRAVGQFGGKADRGFGAKVEIAGGIGQLAHLGGGGIDHGFVAIARIDAPETGEAVDQIAPLVIGDGGTFGMAQHAHAARLVALKRRYRMNQMAAIEFDQRVGKHVRLRHG